MTRIDRTELSGRSDSDTWKGLAAGLIGGFAGSFAMAALQGMMGWVRGGGPSPALDAVAGDIAANDRRASVTTGPSVHHRPSTVRAVRMASRFAFGRVPSREREADAGRAFHFAFGTAVGGAYGMLVEYARWTSIGSGIPFGAAQVLLADEFSVPALGLSEPPSRASASAHLSSLLAHAGYGLATEMVRRRVRTWL